MTVFVYGTPIVARDREKAEEALIELFDHLIEDVGVENHESISPVWFVELGPPELGPIPREALEAMIRELPPDGLTAETPRQDEWVKAGTISEDCPWGESALQHFGAPYCRGCVACDWGPNDEVRNAPKSASYREGGWLVISGAS